MSGDLTETELMPFSVFRTALRLWVRLISVGVAMIPLTIRLRHTTAGRMFRKFTLDWDEPSEAVGLTPDNASIPYGSSKDNKLWLRKTGVDAK